MKPIWKQIYSRIKAAVIDLDAVEVLLEQTTKAIAAAYHVDCLLWAGLQTHPDVPRVYATPGWWNALEQSGFQPIAGAATPSDENAAASQDVRQFYPERLPPWLIAQQEFPKLVQLENGDLIVPVASYRDSFYTDGPQSSVASTLQFVLQLSRPSDRQTEQLQPQPVGEIASLHTQTAHAWRAASVQDWSLAEIESIEIVCSQLEMAYSALYWRDRLEQSRLQAALVGRIARLLNSSLNPDEIVGRIVAELGQGLHSDRCILVDLRDDPVNILAIWDHPDRDLAALEQRQIERGLWQNVLEMFLQGGASFLKVETIELEPDPLQDWLQDIGAASVLLIPLFIQSEFFGTVALLSYQHSRVYQLDELQTIRQVADQAAIALTNAQHYQSLWYKQEALRLQNNSLQLEVIRDELTQLMNRRSLERELEQLSANAVWAVQSAFSVIVCDIDYFKLVNDTHGHRVGDEVLQVVAARLQKQLRRGTYAYRYGGEEFVVILAETLLVKALDVAERLRQAVRSTPIQTTVGTVDITASFGVAQQDANQDHHAWDVLQRADRALYEAKRQGRDRVEILK
jgi:diguanylate cyclase (GGDEF)-like protein